MDETIYIDKSSGSGAFAILFTSDVKAVHTGLEVITENDGDMTSEISRLCGIDIFTKGHAPDVRLYSVPYLEAFASDSRGGWFALTQDGGSGPVYHIRPDLSAHMIAEYFGGLLDLTVSDPDWRQKHLPGGPWPRLPGEPEKRKALSEALRLPLPEPEEIQSPGPLPRVFASRAEAEKEFPIQDVWTVLRQKKTPRFQVHQMMSPADREGRALVHYTSWQETYTGLMDPRILETHTLERCRKIAAGSRSEDNLVVLDRENGDRVAGFVCFLRRARQIVSVPEAGEIVALYVLKEYQGLGLGKMLLEAALSWLCRPRTALFVLKGNEKAIGFYEHMGFRFTGHVADAELNGGSMTELEMVLEREAT